jgi:arsenical pump membrane protein
MYLVVFGLNNAGLTDYLTRLLEGFAGYGVVAASVGTGVTIAVLSALMNNMPTVMIGALSIEPANASGVVREAMIYANVIGADLGPKMTPIGSLATLLWLHVLQRKGTKISWGYYFKVGVQITTPVLLATLLALAGWLVLIG